jgi:predicted kinase
VVLIEIPYPALVALIGISGSGKSTFAHRHFAPTQVLSSDAFRAMVSDDENDMSVTDAAFEVLQLVARKRLQARRLAVIDATNVQLHAQTTLVRMAREYGIPPVAIVLDVPVPVCWERTQARTDRTISRPVLARQHRDLRRSVERLDAEGFLRTYQLAGAVEVDSAVVSIEAPQ